ncbi:hypothetical protein SteCoe_35420 [Stentor coeruleus]|uniref:Type 1 phosphatases regulator n=1 Tax=Stentor coeruleus TaxID=5963 RepID=A0A1R2ASB2_9CILI|nr:hypothetical protein SteCoe_35420 [Stentor coeruleus]
MEGKIATLVQTENQNVTVLRLKPEKKNVKFSEDTIDNEEMNKKKSNICCIYRRKDCSSESSGDEDVNDYERQPRYKK